MNASQPHARVIAAEPQAGEVAASEHAPVEPPVSPAYRRYVLGLLCTVYLFNFIDRQIMSMLQRPIQQEFDLSDTQIGLLGGFAFALVYSILGVPVAHLADRTSRKLVIVISLAFWSGMTALGGLSSGFLTLALSRAGVGVGEAGCSPPATSLLADYYPPQRRARANAIYSAAIYAGYLIAYVVGGQVSQRYGWRWAFALVGLPGVLLSLAVFLTLREPMRTDASGAVARDAGSMPLWPALVRLWRIRSVRWLIVASSLHAFATLGITNFMPLFLARSHHMQQAEIGNWLGPVTGIGGMLGAIAGGYLADRLGARDRRWLIWICAISVLISVPFSFVTYLHPDRTLALLAFAPAMLLGVMYLGPSLTALQALAGPNLRAVSVSIFYLFNNLLGLGAGAWVTGLLSDKLRASSGEASLRHSLCIMVAVNVISFVCYAKTSTSVRADLEPVAGRDR